MDPSSNSLSLSLEIDTTFTMTVWDTDTFLTSDDALELVGESFMTLGDDVADLEDGSDSVTLVDTAATIAPVDETEPLLLFPDNAPVVSVAQEEQRELVTPRSPTRPKRMSVFSLLTNRRYLRKRKDSVNQKGDAVPAKPAKKKKVKAYSGPALENEQDHFILQANMRIQLQGAANIRDAAATVKAEWTKRGIVVPDFECRDKHTLVVPGSTSWLAEHDPALLKDIIAGHVPKSAAAAAAKDHLAALPAPIVA